MLNLHPSVQVIMVHTSGAEDQGMSGGSRIRMGSQC